MNDSGGIKWFGKFKRTAENDLKQLHCIRNFISLSRHLSIHYQPLSLQTNTQKLRKLSHFSDIIFWLKMSEDNVKYNQLQ